MEKEKNKEMPKEKKEENIDYKDNCLRAMADYENLKKRVEKEKAEYVRFSNQLLIAELFPIMDSFDTAISSVEKSSDKEGFLKGLKMLQGQFHSILEANGLKKIKTVGEKFDPNIQEASEDVTSSKFPEGVITEEVRSGYMLNGRLLRPAVVKVSKGKNDKARKKEEQNG